MESDKENKESAEEVSDSSSVPAAPEKKKTRFRWLKWLLIAFAAFVAAVLVVVAFFLGPIVKYGVNTFGASALGVDKCSLGEAKIYPFAGYVHFEKIFVGKPLAEGVSFSRDMLSVGLVDVDFDMSTLFAKKKVLEHFEVRDVSVNYEQLVSGQKNIDVLLKNLAGEPSKEAPKPKAESESEEIFIGARYFVIGNVNVAAYIRGMPIVFPSMSADFSRGIGIDEDLTPVGFGMKIAGNFMSVIEFFRNSVFGDAAGATADVVSGAANLTGRAAKGAADVTTDAAKATAGAVSDAAGAVSDFFFGSEEKKEKDADAEK